MKQKLHERTPQETGEAAGGHEKVHDDHQRKRADQSEEDDDFDKGVTLPPSGQPSVPDGREELLAMRMRHKLKTVESNKTYVRI